VGNQISQVCFVLPGGFPTMSGTFTLYYDRFWIGLVEFRDDDGVRAGRHVFGAEPNNAELLAFTTGREFDALARRAHAAPTVPDDQRPPAGSTGGVETGRVWPARPPGSNARSVRAPRPNRPSRKT
jgi:hypothetical protein